MSRDSIEIRRRAAIWSMDRIASHVRRSSDRRDLIAAVNVLDQIAGRFLRETRGSRTVGDGRVVDQIQDEAARLMERANELVSK
jgi:hypothetical protein